MLDAADVLVAPAARSRRARARTPPRRSAGRRSAGSTRTSRRTCPSCRSRGAPARRTSGTSSAPSPRRPRAASAPSAGSPRSSGSTTGSSVVRHRHEPARVAGDHRDRAAPVALARDQPVAQAVRDPALAESPRRSSSATIACIASFAERPVNGPELTSTSSGPCSVNAPLAAASPSARRDDLPHRQPVRLRELEVALVVRGHGHDRAGAVVHQHVVGDPDRDPLAVDRVDDDSGR